MTEYTETEADADDAEGKILEALAGGMPYAFVAATQINPDISLRVAANYDGDTLKALLSKTLQALPGGKNNISDGYHTFGELYDHRRALTAALAVMAGELGMVTWRSKEHHPEDNPMFEGGYFIVGIELPSGTFTYHYKLSHWDDFAVVPELAHAPRWDGAAPVETVGRLLKFARID